MITNMLTFDATVQDITATNTVPDAFTARDLLPKEHLLDAGYIDGTRIVTAAREHGVTLTGPLHSGKTTSQAAGPYSQSAFTVDWDNRIATCPTGKTSGQWADTMSHRETPVVRIEFSTTDCRSCTSRPQCISSTRTAHRSITLRPRPEHEAIQLARADYGTPECRERYAARNGIEGTISHAVHTAGMRQARYHGLVRTRLSTSSLPQRSTSPGSTHGPATGPEPAPASPTRQHFAPPGSNPARRSDQTPHSPTASRIGPGLARVSAGVGCACKRCRVQRRRRTPVTPRPSREKVHLPVRRGSRRRRPAARARPSRAPSRPSSASWRAIRCTPARIGATRGRVPPRGRSLCGRRPCPSVFQVRADDGGVEPARQGPLIEASAACQEMQRRTFEAEER